MGLRYGGKIVSDYSAMRGPCPEGFHVPTYTEWQAIKTAVETWWSGNGSGQVMALASYLKIPLGGYRQGSSGDKTGQGTSGYYWTCTGYSSTASRCYKISSSSTSWGNVYQALGCSIRPFKDIPAVPDSTWTVEYQGTGDAGIYSNSTLGLISLSTDGTNRITIADKNVGATTTYSYLDTLSESNCGKCFQRGNCYGFAWTGSITTDTARVDTTNYGPGNYYYGSSFIRSSTTWASTDNRNLRGGATGVQQRPAPIKKRYYGGKMVNDYSAMRGPCPVGFHVPSKSEFQTITNAGIAIGAWNSDGTGGGNMLSYLKIPLAGYHGTNISGAGTSYQDKQVFLWCCTATSTYYGDTLRFGGTTSTYNDKWKIETYIGRGGGNFIRPIKDIPVAPDGNWTTLYNGSSTSVGAGIFHNPTLGLISISSDGTNWTTIADKNLGATAVYNSGDTLSESNCGGWFQWGNNYMFPFSSSFTYATEQVDATNYGPGNYYSSSTYIGKEKWDTSNNKNLRGGVTGVQQRPAEVIKVYKGNTLIREKS